MKTQKDEAKDVVKKTAKGFKIVWAVGLLLLGSVFLGVLIFVGVRLWEWLAPLFGK